MSHHKSLHVLTLMLALTASSTSFAPKRVNKKEQLHEQLKKLRYLDSESSFSDIEKEQKGSARILRAMKLTPGSAAAYRAHVNKSVKKNSYRLIGTQIKRGASELVHITSMSVSHLSCIGIPLCWLSRDFQLMSALLGITSVSLFPLAAAAIACDDYSDTANKLRKIIDAQASIAQQLDA